MARENWILHECEKQNIIDLARELDIFPVTARLLINRGITDTAHARAFLEKSSDHFHDPFALPDIKEAAERLLSAVRTGERIAVYGDYDADGVSAVCILYDYLNAIGAVVEYYIPDRAAEGYGLHADVLRQLAASGTRLVVTVDTGVTALEEAELARTLGVDLIVTDHHACPKSLPQCCAVVNPKRPDSAYPFAGLAGVGVAFKLMCACEMLRNPGEQAQKSAVAQLCRTYGAVCAIGTIADMVPLLDENRLIASLGLGLIGCDAHPGVTALLRQAGAYTEHNSEKRKFSASLVSFTIAPRINAAGRMGCAESALRLLLSKGEEEAQPYACALCEYNTERQRVEDGVVREAYEKIMGQSDPAAQQVLIAAGDNWHSGVIGIAAGKITQQFGRPCALITFEGADGVGRGSARSVEGFRLAQALDDCDAVLEHHGGHDMAAGFSVRRENMAAFRQALRAAAKKQLGDSMPQRQIAIDDTLSPADLALALAQEFALLEPFGCENPVPLFLTKDLLLRDITPVGGGRHTRLTLCRGDWRITAMYFGTAPETLPYRTGDRVDVVYQIDINEFMNRTSVQMLIMDMDFSEEVYQELEQQREIYGRICRGEAVECADMLPDRQDFADLYRCLRDRCGERETHVTDTALSLKLRMPLYRLLLALDILAEMRLITCSAQKGALCIALLHATDKVDLEKSPTLCALRAKYISEETPGKDETYG